VLANVLANPMQDLRLDAIRTGFVGVECVLYVVPSGPARLRRSR